MKADVKPSNMVRLILTDRCLNQISRCCCGPLKSECSHTFYRATPHVCIICRMRNSYRCWLFLGAVDVFRDNQHKWPNCVFVPALYKVAVMFTQPYAKQSIIWNSFSDFKRKNLFKIRLMHWNTNITCTYSGMAGYDVIDHATWVAKWHYPIFFYKSVSCNLIWHETSRFKFR